MGLNPEDLGPPVGDPSVRPRLVGSPATPSRPDGGARAAVGSPAGGPGGPDASAGAGAGSSATGGSERRGSGGVQIPEIRLPEIHLPDMRGRARIAGNMLRRLGGSGAGHLAAEGVKKVGGFARDSAISYADNFAFWSKDHKLWWLAGTAIGGASTLGLNAALAPVAPWAPSWVRAGIMVAASQGINTYLYRRREGDIRKLQDSLSKDSTFTSLAPEQQEEEYKKRVEAAEKRHEVASGRIKDLMSGIVVGSTIASLGITFGADKWVEERINNLSLHSPFEQGAAPAQPPATAPSGAETAGGGVSAGPAEQAWDPTKAALEAPKVNIESTLTGEQLSTFEALRDSGKIGEIASKTMGGYGDYLSLGVNETNMGGVGQSLVKEIVNNNPNLANMPAEQLNTVAKKLIEGQANEAMKQAILEGGSLNDQTVTRALEILHERVGSEAFQTTVATHAQEKVAQVVNLAVSNPETFQAADITHLVGVSDAEVMNIVNETLKQSSDVLPSSDIGQFVIQNPNAITVAPIKQAVFEAVAAQAQPALKQQAATIATLPPDQALTKLAEIGKYIPTEQVVENLSAQLRELFVKFSNINTETLNKALAGLDQATIDKIDKIINGSANPEAAAKALQKDPNLLEKIASLFTEDYPLKGAVLASVGSAAMATTATYLLIKQLIAERTKSRPSAATPLPVVPSPAAAPSAPRPPVAPPPPAAPRSGVVPRPSPGVGAPPPPAAPRPRTILRPPVVGDPDASSPIIGYPPAGPSRTIRGGSGTSGSGSTGGSTS